MLDFLKKIHDQSLEEAKKLTFDKDHPWHRNMVALHGSIIEFTSAIINSFENNNIIAVEPLLRSLLEAYVEFVNLSNNRRYGYNMEASYHDQWIKVLKASKTNSNPYLKQIGEMEDETKSLKDHEKELETLEKNGYKPLNIFNKFRTAGMENEYRSIYNFLSNDSHSNIRALISRHFEIDLEKKTFQVVFYKNWETEDYKHYMIDAAFYLLKTGERLHDILKTERCELFTELLIELEEINKKSA